MQDANRCRLEQNIHIRGAQVMLVPAGVCLGG